MRMKRAWRCRAANAASRAPGARRLRRGGEVPVIDPDDLADKLSMPTIRSIPGFVEAGSAPDRRDSSSMGDLGRCPRACPAARFAPGAQARMACTVFPADRSRLDLRDRKSTRL